MSWADIATALATIAGIVCVAGFGLAPDGGGRRRLAALLVGLGLLMLATVLQLGVHLG